MMQTSGRRQKLPLRPGYGLHRFVEFVLHCGIISCCCCVCVCVDEGGKRGETGAVLDFDRELLPPSTRQPWIRTVWVTASHGQM
jgi:hypothetical protein